MTPLPTRLAAALASASYVHDVVADRLGSQAHAALGRNETTPGLRRTTSGGALDGLIRLFLLQHPVSLTEAERALPGLVEELVAHGVLDRSAGEVVARLDLRPYAAGDDDLWVMSDLTPGLDGGPARVEPDHVLGISPASTSLAQLTGRQPVGRALDLGTGCGVQALHLATHAERVVATDVNRRALWMAAFNAELNGVPAGAIDVREGSLFEPVAGEAFDLITTNPPFVISPATGERLVYRDSGLPGDLVVERIVRQAPQRLADGGWCHVLANWVVAVDRPWDERLSEWLDDSCDALVVQRETLDPAAYVELWLKDAGLHGGPGYVERYDAWLGWLEDQGVEGVGFGWLNLRKVPDTTPTTHTFLDWPHDLEQPIAPAIRVWGRAVGWLRDHDDAAVLASHVTMRGDVRQEAVGLPGHEHPETIVLRQQRGFRRARTADTVEAALVGASDGELSIEQILAALADLLDLEPEAVRATYLPSVRELLVDGFLLGD